MATRNPTDVLIDDAVEKVKSTASRSIALKLVPFLSLIFVPVTAWLQDKVGINLNSTDLAVYIGSATLAIAGAAITYIRGRLNGIYQLHTTLIDKGIDAFAQGEEDLKKNL